MSPDSSRRASVAIIGAGMSGICAAILLREAGITDVTIYEKASDLGGTWRDNTYPGLTCDVPSRFYQFSFAKNPNWSHRFSPGPEIQEYFRGVVADHGLNDVIRYGTEIKNAEYVDGRWRITTGTGDENTVDFLVSAAGILHHPRFPDIKGLDDFEGAIFHSARWDHSAATTGKRVGVVGNGSTGVQIICGLAETAGHLELFQRHAQWVLQTKNPPYRKPAKFLHARVPLVAQFGYARYRAQLGFFAKGLIKPGWRRTLLTRTVENSLENIEDPVLRAKLTPDFQPMCKRLIFSPTFFEAIQRPNVALVTDGIDHIEAKGIVTADGVLHELDVIALATGFDSHAFIRPTRVVGANGLTLDEAWDDGPYAHLTVAIPGFPNFFMMLGPHSPVGNYSLTAIAEAQATHIRTWIEAWQRGEFDTVSPRSEAAETFNQSMRDAMPGTIWVTGCDSWYLGKDGLPELWPWTPAEHGVLLRSPTNAADYDFGTRPAING